MSQWTFICASADLLPGEMRTGYDEVTEAAIVVFNLDGTLYALEDLCTHDEFELSAGVFNADEGSVECVLHGARFDVRDGRALCAPAYTSATRFPVKRENDGIWARDDRED
ncbi:MAG: non-heme iron oxygenase ferredoxin subunit [Stenotrophomonas sp.]